MTDGGDIDWQMLEKIVEEQIEGGVDGLVPVGTTGESPTLNTEEHLAVIDRVVRASRDRIPVIAGTGANSTREALHLTQEADKLGVTAFLQVAPYYNKPSPEGVYQHFKAIAGCTDKELVLYSIPGRCGIEIATTTMKRLFEDCPNIRTIKEAGGDVNRVRELKQACPELVILSGDDGLIVPFVEAGAQGVISVASNLMPGIIHDITQAALEGSFDQAQQMAEKWEPLLTDLVFLEGNPVSIKESLYRAGRIPSPRVRLPLVRMSPSNQQLIQQHLESLKIIAS